MNEACFEELSRVLASRFSAEVVQETLKRLLENLQTGRLMECPNPAYAFAVAKRVKFEIRRFHEPRPVPRLEPDARDELLDDPRLKELMNQVFTGPERQFFRDYFLPEVKDLAGHRARLAKKLKIEPNTLAKRASRLLKRLVNARLNAAGQQR